jgi:2-dehydropantoate 2-reductase
LRTIVYGAGAVGGVIGGRLFEHDHEVVLIARGRHYEVLARSGLRVQSPDSDVTLSVPVVDEPSRLDFRDDDIVVLAMKSQDTALAVAELASVAPPTIAVICAQNGIENERIALRAFPRVYGMCVMCPTTHLTPGVVQANSAPVTGLLDLGCWPAGTDGTAEALADVLRKATFSSQARPDISRWKWGKLLLNLGNAVEALCGPGSRQGDLVTRARKEAIACLDAAGIAYVTREEDAARRSGLLKLSPVSGSARGGGSSWQSLARSTGTIEAEYLNGEIVLLGRLHGVPTPVNAALARLAVEAARQRRRPGWLSESDVLAAAEAADVEQIL